MKPSNLIILMSDEHSSKVLGCYGHPQVKTPNMDRLAASGTRFEHAYSNSPICVPARAAFATGRYVSETGYWDNAIAYDGRVPGWGHRLQETGHRVVSIGKLHYMNDTDPTGLDEQVIPMHIADGYGDLQGLIRDDPPRRTQSKHMTEEIGPNVNQYHNYDLDIAAKAVTWLKEEAPKYQDQPWVLFVSFICPHYPFEAPEEFYNMYSPDDIPMPKQRIDDLSKTHEWWKLFENAYCIDDYFESDEDRRIAIAAYYGLCTFTDRNIGTVLKGLEDAGLSDNTRIAYTSDHGENLGARKLWAKSVMYEESTAVPLILSGPDIPKGKVCSTPASLIDFYQTILDCAGVDMNAEEKNLPGQSLLDIVNEPDDAERLIFSEYHACGAKTGSFMLRVGNYKYFHYVDYAPELYDLKADPEELHNLATDPAYSNLLEKFEAQLRSMVDPEEVNARSKRDQQAWIEKVGGLDFVLKRGGISATPVPGEESNLTT